MKTTRKGSLFCLFFSLNQGGTAQLNIVQYDTATYSLGYGLRNHLQHVCSGVCPL